MNYYLIMNHRAYEVCWLALLVTRAAFSSPAFPEKTKGMK